MTDAIAALLNAHFIPVKVDRELNPALDAYLIDYVTRTQGRAGWPLNVFLTPEGYPLIGTSYLPPARFQAALLRLNEAWGKEPDKMRDLARQVLLELTSESPRQPPSEVPVGRLRQQFVREALALGDPLEGGFGNQNKFPMAPQLLALLRIRQQEGHPVEDLDHLLTITLEQMARQGLRDQLGGGFFRYPVDPSWQVPHFEKMLHTQALLARVYLLAGEIYRRQDYLDVARDTLDFVLREMRGPQGMFIASFSAVDAAGQEGGAYLWQTEALDSLLGEADAQLARRRWAMQGAPALEGGFLPRQGESVEAIAVATGSTPEDVRARLQSIRKTLLQARAKRSPPADTKELAGWNGLLLSALAEAARQLDEPHYLQEARRLAGRLQEQLWHAGKLWRANAGGKPVGQASLADYSYLAQGLQSYLQVAEDQAFEAWRRALIAAAWERFHDARGWRLAEKAPLPGMGSAWAVEDGALPAAPAVWLEVAGVTDDDALAASVQEARRKAWSAIREEPFWHASYLVSE